jgi:hypothetical protein
VVRHSVLVGVAALLEHVDDRAVAAKIDVRGNTWWITLQPGFIHNPETSRGRSMAIAWQVIFACYSCMINDFAQLFFSFCLPTRMALFIIKQDQVSRGGNGWVNRT